ncbi:putative agmatinase [Halobacteriovorax marinus SJ]|uniref:Agmatinase n=1 Tax=Halobacteriovorax marinus (strain ATCC BAA-682 / DSM 15412 / SJ) TaxID=862908 RepID=E1X476_HALMS|nr:arginase family protein [Halobacteriovorax marinus]CBW27048.1 putative agmatinase [Halobacteriovorax marinus SJ]
MSKNIIDTTKSLLCPPGNGVFTVNTAKERKDKLHQALYKTTANIEQLWKDSIEENLESSSPLLLGVCSDTGGGIQRGANWGPLFLRNTLLEEHPELNYKDIGDIRVIPHLLHDKYLNDKTIENCRKALYDNGDSEHPVSALSLTEEFCDQLFENFPKKKLFSIGGDHSVSYPLVKSYLRAKKKQGIKAAIIHFDAHTDLLVERLGIDICFGSWCTHILPFLDSPECLIQLGIRSSGKDRSHWENTFGVQQFWASEINKEGARSIAKRILNFLKKEEIDELYVSFDIDALDETYASATGTPEPGGLNPEQSISIIKELAKEFKITGADMVEIAPLVCADHVNHPEPQTTLSIGAAISACLIEAMDSDNS